MKWYGGEVGRISPTMRMGFGSCGAEEVSVAREENRDGYHFPIIARNGVEV
jgi:hypothetical protein